MKVVLHMVQMNAAAVGGLERLNTFKTAIENSFVVALRSIYVDWC